MPNLFEREGHGLWVALREHIGAPLPKNVVNARPPASHPFKECKAPSSCPDHRAAYRRDLAHRKEAQAREDQAVVTYQRNLANQAAMRQVAGAAGGTVAVDDL